MTAPSVIKELRGWRRLAWSIWRNPQPDPTMTGDVEVDASALLGALEEVRERTGVRVGVTHAVGRAVAHAMTVHPDLNVRKRGRRLISPATVDVSFIVAFDGGSQNAGVTVKSVERLSLAGLAEALDTAAEEVRAGGDPSLRRASRLLDLLPRPLIRGVLRLLTWLAVDRDVDLTRYGLPATGLRAGGFGSALISSVGMLGIDRGYPLLNPYTRVPVALLIGRITERPLVVDGEVVARPVFTICATIDHRYYDGSHVGRLVGAMREYLADPAAFEPV